MNYRLDSVFFFKQKTAYEMRISDWSSDVCSSDLHDRRIEHDIQRELLRDRRRDGAVVRSRQAEDARCVIHRAGQHPREDQVGDMLGRVLAIPGVDRKSVV